MTLETVDATLGHLMDEVAFGFSDCDPIASVPAA